jgi:triosephosphate isomerase
MKYVIANLKMNFVSADECDRYLKALKQEWKQRRGAASELIVCPSFPYLERFRKGLPKSVVLGAQDVFWEPRGSFTGEVSPAMLNNLGVRYAIIGHSERRQYLQETDEMVGKKIAALLQNDMHPLLCVGETAEERADGHILKVIRRQVEEALREVAPAQLRHMLIAYEPRWAIGTDRTPSAHEIMEMKVLLRKVLAEKYGAETAEQVPLLYGGSVKARLMKGVCSDPGMDGVLVGRESLVPEELAKIVAALKAS